MFKNSISRSYLVEVAEEEEGQVGAAVEEEGVSTHIT
jgi:hypothetical protein